MIGTTFAGGIHPLTGKPQATWQPAKPRVALRYASKQEILDAMQQGHSTARAIATSLNAAIAMVAAELLKMHSDGAVSRCKKWCRLSKGQVYFYSIHAGLRRCKTQQLRDYIQAHPSSCTYDIARALDMSINDASSKLSKIEKRGEVRSVLLLSGFKRAFVKHFSVP